VTTAIDTARFFLRLAADEEPDAEYLTHMRLQKLLYYAQGLSLACRDTPMFEDAIQAWRHGPVVPSVYPTFADYDSNPIPLHEAQPVSINKQDQEFIRTVWESYRDYSAIALLHKTHAEDPWKQAREGLERRDRSTEEITRQSLREFFCDLCASEMQQHSGITREQAETAEDDVNNGRITSWETLRSRFAQSP